MSTITMRDGTGADAGTVELPDAVFGIEPNVSVMHQVVTAQLAAARAGTHSTKTRSEVRGGGAKPWRQKGTGRARQGSIRSPQWRGGGVAHGPKPRDYRQRTPKKMVSLALRSALSDRCALDQVVVVSDWPMTAPSTKGAIALLGALGLRTDGTRPERVLVVLDRSEEAVWKSFRNLGDRVQIILTDELNAYDVLVNDSIVFSRATLAALTARFGGAYVEVEIEVRADEEPADEEPADEEPAEEDAADGGAE
jgi:large subunit ribosomal protein L4